MRKQGSRGSRAIGVAVAAAVVLGLGAFGVVTDNRVSAQRDKPRLAKNVILFVGDGMGVSTVTATRVYSVGVDGELVVDQFPYTAL